MKGITTQEGRETLNKFKMEAANEVGVNLKQGYNGDLTAREVGSVGGDNSCSFIQIAPPYASVTLIRWEITFTFPFV